MKPISRRTFVSSAAGAALFALGACTQSNSSDSDATKDDAKGDKTYKIGVIQLTKHDALDAANTGFIKALDESGIKYEADQQNAQNDQSTCTTIAQKFVGDGDDLIFAIATPAAQAVAAATKEIPIVGTAITDYASTDLADSNDAPGRNITGTSDMNPIDEQMQMIKKVLPDAKSVGLLYCTAEANSEVSIKLAEESLDKLGLEHKRYTVSSSNEIQSVVESMIGEVDAGYSPTDNTIAASMEQVGQIVKEGKLPFIAGERGMCLAGGLCTLSIDYTTLGYMAGQMAIKILTEGADPATMPIEQEDTSQLEIVKNEDMAQTLGIDLSVLDN